MLSGRTALCARLVVLTNLLPRSPCSRHLPNSLPTIRPCQPRRSSKPRRGQFATMAPIERLTDNLETSALDDRSYRVIRLSNQLEAFLVHDPNTDKASASVNVKVGSFSDADDMPGMAHAVEHLLFMGTKKVGNRFSGENRMLRSSSIQRKMPTTCISPPIVAHRMPTQPRPRPITFLKWRPHQMLSPGRPSMASPCRPCSEPWIGLPNFSSHRFFYLQPWIES